MCNCLCKALAAILLLSILGGLLCACSDAEGYVTGNEWLLIQKQSLEDVEAYTTGMDEVFSLYIVGGISDSDFLIELSLLKEQYLILKQFRAELKSANPIKEGSHSYVSKRGSDALDNYYETLGGILDYALDDSGKPRTPDELSYGYLSFQQTLSTSLAEYVTSVVWLEEANRDKTIA